MTRPSVRQAQGREPDPPLHMVRVTVTAINASTVAVQMPGSSTSVLGNRVPGLTYTVGGLAQALVQEPAVGPIIPIQ